jgi:hypothetical protein
MSKTLTVNVKELYAPSITPAIVDVPELTFLMIDGAGNPNTAPAFQDAIQALYSLSYGIHFALKNVGVESHVKPLEALFWIEGEGDFLKAKADQWRWTEMILQPDEVTPALFEKVRDEVKRKKPIGSLAKVRLEKFDEGKSAQILHIGPYSAEMPTIERLHTFIAKQGYTMRGKHHEIYLGDPRRAAPDKLKTAIRQPVV